MDSKRLHTETKLHSKAHLGCLDDCASFGFVCDSSTGFCVQCLSALQCSPPTPACDPVNNACVQCNTDSSCNATSRCVNHVCVATLAPTKAPTIAPTNPTPAPTQTPTVAPTVAPTASPTTAPTPVPTTAPTVSPTVEPTVSPTNAPTPNPTISPTITPTVAPTNTPTQTPTTSPTVTPTSTPTTAPTQTPPQVTCTSDTNCNQFSYCDMTINECHLVNCSDLALCGGAGCLAGICGVSNHTCQCGACFDDSRLLPCTTNSQCLPCSDAICSGTPTCNGTGYCESITFTCDPYNGDCDIISIPECGPTNAPTQTLPQDPSCTMDTDCNQFSYCNTTTGACRLLDCSNLAQCGGAGCLAGICSISNHACMCGNCFDDTCLLTCTDNTQCFPCSDAVCSGTPTCNGTGYCESITFTCDPYNGDCNIPSLPICTFAPTRAPTQTSPQVTTCTSDSNCNQFSYCDMTINECRLVNCSNLASCGGAGCLAGICGISNHACMCGNCFNVARVLPCTTNAQCFPCSDVICSGTPTCNGTGFCESIPFTCDPYNGDCQIPGLPICAQTRAPTVTPPQVTVCTSDPDCNQFSYCDMTTRVCRLLDCSNLTLCGGAGCLAGICGLANHSCMCGNCFDTTRVLPCTDNSECFPCSDAVCLGTPTCNGTGYCESITFTCDPYNGDCQIPGLPVCKTGIIIKSNDALGSIGIVLGIVILVVMGTVLIIFKLRRDGTTFNRNSFGNSYRNRIPLKQYHRV